MALQSPGFNPFENLWWDLKAVAARMPPNINELEAFACEEWAKIQIEWYKRLVSTYRKHILSTAQTKGIAIFGF